ncbi:MAG: DDE-type integrase/transposase/recombinase [Gammaproteobacteria bacterium]|nr:DDE-type integrase/transposase/recombinase [Gammaproteobacteria bacterium]
MGQSLTKHEVAALTGRSLRWVERNREQLGAVPAGIAPNGRPDLRYNLASLPADAQRVWSVQSGSNLVQLENPTGQLALSLTLPAGPNLSQEDRAEAERRYRAIAPLVEPAQYRAVHLQFPRRAQLLDFLAAQHQTSARTLYHWLTLYKEGGLPALVAKERSDKGRPRAFNAAALEFIQRAALPQKGVHGVYSVREIFRAYEEERKWRESHAGRQLRTDFDRRKYARYLDEDGRLRDTALLPQASYETFRTWFNRIPEAVRVLAREGEEAFHNTQEIISYRDLSALQPLDYVVMDHRRLDLFCLIPIRGGWKLARPWLTAAIDMRTRKWLAWVIVETPSSDSIAAVLKRVFIDFGLPKAVYWDNGKDFVCEYFEGRAVQSRQSGRVGEIWPGVMQSLGIRVHHAIVKRARAKIIEPNFLAVSNLDRTFPEWCGHKPTARPERFHSLVADHEKWIRGERAATPFRTIHQIAALYDEEIRYRLNERPLEGGEGMQKATPQGRGWRSPNEAWDLLIGQVERRDVPLDTLQFCFARRRQVTVRNAEIRVTFAGRDYHYRLAGNPVALTLYNGRTVELAYDPLDLGDVAVFCENRLLGLAHCAELRRMGEDAFVQDERDRRASKRVVRQFIDAIQHAVPLATPEERVIRRRAVAVERIDPDRPVIAAPVSPACAEASEALARDRAYSFAADETPIAAVPPPPQSEDDEFVFFSRG